MVVFAREIENDVRLGLKSLYPRLLLGLPIGISSIASKTLHARTGYVVTPRVL